MSGSAAFLPSHGATLLVVHLDEFAKATGIVVVGGLGVPKGLQEQRKVKTGENRQPGWSVVPVSGDFSSHADTD